jgi:hypothetical protein
MNYWGSILMAASQQNLDRSDVTAINLFYVLKEMAGFYGIVTLILCMVIVLALEGWSPTALESDR